MQLEYLKDYRLRRMIMTNKKTIYMCEIPNTAVYYYGDKILRIFSIIAHTIEFIFIIYLLVR